MKPSRSLPASKRRKARLRAKPNPMGTMDALHDRLAKIATLSGLLYAVNDPEFLDTRLASDTGFLIGKELREAKALLSKALEAGR